MLSIISHPVNTFINYSHLLFYDYRVKLIQFKAISVVTEPHNVYYDI